MAVSSRGEAILADKGYLFIGLEKASKNFYNDKTNPSGIINLGTAENKLMQSEIISKLSQLSSKTITKESLAYGDMQGLLPLRESVAKFLTEQSAATERIDASHISIHNGAGTVVDSLFQVICDSGDGVLIPVPYYGAFDQDLGKRAQVKRIPVHSSSKDGFQFHLSELESAYQLAIKQGVRVRALLISSPNNPLGYCYSVEQLQTMLDFTEQNGLHFVCDEIYLCSDFSLEIKGQKRFVSTLTLRVRDPERFHVIWAFSKDFCVSGLRCGVLVTRSASVMTALSGLAYFTAVPGNTQLLLAEMLNDKIWTTAFIKTNKQRLHENTIYVRQRLSAIGVNSLPAEAGFFVWIDLRPFIRPQPTVEGEIELWLKLIDAGLYIALGQAFNCGEPGWFRIITAAPREKLDLAVERLRSVIHKNPSVL